MEASERPQLPLDADPDGTVRALEDRLVIERLTVSDERAAALVRDRKQAGQDPAKTVANAIEIGARVLDREDAAVEVDFVRREYERAMAEHRAESERQQREAVERIEQELRRAFGDEAAGGRLADALDSHAREVGEAIEETFGEGSGDGVPARIKDLIEERNEAFLRRLAADDEHNPLRPLLTNFGKWVRERRETQDERDEKLERKLDELSARLAEAIGVQSAAEAVEEAEEAGTRKGRTFEERVNSALERIAEARGDCAHAVGDTPGTGGSKKGDALIEIGAAEGASLGRIVFEIKDSRLSKPKAWGEMNGALEARDADYAVLVVAGEDAVPSGEVEEMHEYQGNKLVVSVDPDEPDGRALELAYRYASLRVRAARESAAGVDASGVLTAAAEARDALGGFKSVKSALTSATNNVERARGGVEEIERALLDRIERIEASIDEADGAG
jgi:hypothetical protein